MADILILPRISMTQWSVKISTANKQLLFDSILIAVHPVCISVMTLWTINKSFTYFPRIDDYHKVETVYDA